jgi:hypothetical protein
VVVGLVLRRNADGGVQRGLERVVVSRSFWDLRAKEWGAYFLAL